jgi:protein gp37
MGVSIENQAFAHRANYLRQVPAAVRFISAEPLLGPIELDLTGIHWVIAGSESGKHARPADLAWFRSLRDQCRANNTPFFLKQFAINGHKISTPELDGKRYTEMPAV